MRSPRTPLLALATPGCLVETQSCTLLGCDVRVRITWAVVVTLDGVARSFDCAANTLPVQCTLMGLRITGRPTTVQIEVTTAAGVRRATLTPTYTRTWPSAVYALQRVAPVKLLFHAPSPWTEHAFYEVTRRTRAQPITQRSLAPPPGAGARRPGDVSYSRRAMSPEALETLGHLSPALSAFLMVGLTGYGLLVAGVVLLARGLLARHRARRVEEAANESATLREGACFLRGTVQHAEGLDHAVRVEITQEGSEAEISGGWTHAWTEVSRTLYAAPFYLEHRAGGRVRVEPGEHVQLLDALDGIVHVNARTRRRVVQLSPGEEVLIEGVLSLAHDPEGISSAAAKGYRDSARGWLLRPKKGQPMLIASERLGDRFRRHARARFVACGIVLLTGLLQAALSYDYRTLSASGIPVLAEVVGHTRWETSSDSGTTEHTALQLDALLPSGQHVRFRAEVTRAEASRVADGARVWTRVVPAKPSLSVLGTRATADGRNVFFVLLLMATAGGLIWHRLRRAKAWHELARVRDTGQGRLAQGARTVRG